MNMVREIVPFAAARAKWIKETHHCSYISNYTRIKMECQPFPKGAETMQINGLSAPAFLELHRKNIMG